MLRRHILTLPFGLLAARAQNSKTGADPDNFTAGASEDATPRVAIVLSSFKGSQDHDGTALAGLRAPAPTNSPLSEAQIEDMVRKATELGNTRRGDLAALIAEANWIVVKPHIAAHRDANGRIVAGSVADPRVVSAVIGSVAAKSGGKRITVAEGPSCSGAAFDPWTSGWDGVFGGISYRNVVERLAQEYRNIRFDIVDLNRDETMDMQTPARAGVSGSGVLKMASALLRCDALITVAPLATSVRTGVALTFGSYWGALPASTYGAGKEKASVLGPASEVLVDLFSFRPPDYTIVGGEWGLEGGDPQTRDAASIRHNLILAGANAVAVDRVAAAIMGFEPGRIMHLELASRRGFGVDDLDSIWTRGNDIEEATHRFRIAPSK